MTGRRFGSGGLTIDTAVIFALFAVFTVSVLFVLISGAGVYKSAAVTISDNYGSRTAEAYIISKIRHTDAVGTDAKPLVEVKRFGGNDVLALYEEYGEERNVTYIYWCEGYICELYAEADDAFDASLGEKIIVSQGLELSLDKSLLSFKIDGRESIYVSLRCAE